MASVSYRHVYKRFGDVEVVTDLNLEIKDKEFVVFVGPIRLWQIDKPAYVGRPGRDHRRRNRDW
jgi:hypothetical protein